VKLWLVYLLKHKADKARKFLEVIVYALRQAAAVIESADFVARHPSFNADGAKALQLRRRTLDLLLVEKEKNDGEFFQMAIKAAVRATRQCVTLPCAHTYALKLTLIGVEHNRSGKVVVTGAVAVFCQEVQKMWGSTASSDQLAQLDWLLCAASLLQVHARCLWGLGGCQSPSLIDIAP
jgi:hypothetical protein